MSESSPVQSHTPDNSGPCSCLTSVVEVDAQYPSDDGSDSGEVMGTIYGPCGAGTTRRFAPGHDAQLKGLLIRLHIAGLEYHRTDGGMLTSGSPIDVARQYGWEHFLTSARSRRIAKVDARAIKAERKAQAKAARDEDPEAAAKMAAMDDAHGAPSGHDVIDGPPASSIHTPRVGDEVATTVRGRQVTGTITKVDDTVVRVIYTTTKGEQSVAVKAHHQYQIIS